MASTQQLQAPFPWFGGKSSVADMVWQRFGVVRNYVEPFMGSLAMLLGRPLPFDGTETVNDADGFVANFWRATAHDPEAVAHYADWPVNENDLHARHVWLIGQRETITARLEGDPEWYDAKVAGWWCWGQCCWIGSGWCSGKGPWQTVEIDGVRQLVHLGNAGQGVNRKRVHLGNAGQGVNRKRVHLGSAGRGVNRKRVHLGDAGRGVNRHREPLYDWFAALADRLRGVRVCCGDWSRVCGPTPTTKQGLTAVFLDPPYADEKRDGRCYVASGTEKQSCLSDDETKVSRDVRQWAIERGDDPMMRIALCGYEGEHAMPETWECVPWSARGGYSSQGSKADINRHRERLWFSPHCEKVRRQLGLFGEAS